ncbi:MAG: DUF4279 domain-containing protein [Clostridiales bacterium]|jgi:hypothetical protein|nr:DUF4279 domain-containing protein [Clostridiales bacterium]MDR1439341.1 DUF4279 domain-containing protein [Clostridiales bacterium]
MFSIKETKIMVEFSMVGDLLDHEFLTHILGINPTSKWHSGDPGRYATHKEAAWNLSTGYMKSLDVNDQLGSILDQLQDKASVLIELKKRFDLFYRFDIVIKIIDSIAPAFHLKTSAISFAHAIGAAFEMDLYAWPNMPPPKRGGKSILLPKGAANQADAYIGSRDIDDYVIKETYFNYPTVKVDFRILGNDFDIAYITQCLSLKPNYVWPKGEYGSHGLTRSETCWALSSRYRKSYFVDEQLKPILKLLRHKTAKLLMLKKKYNLSFQIYIVLKIIDGRAPALGFDIDDLDFAQKVGAEFVVDFYSR